MYWKIAEQEDDDGTYWHVFNYFEIVPIPHAKDPWYNGVMHTMIYPPKYQLVIKAAFSLDPAAFESWYESNKHL